MPGQQYARDFLTEGLELVTDATERVIDSTIEIVPGASAAAQILQETVDVIPGRVSSCAIRHRFSDFWAGFERSRCVITGAAAGYARRAAARAVRAADCGAKR